MSAIPVQDVLKYLNQARTAPKAFAQHVSKEINQFINNSTLPLYPGCNYSTNEGKSAWKEAYQFLSKQKPLPAYQLNQGLTLAAQDHAIDMAQTGIFGHSSSNGASLTDRITKRCGQAHGSWGENIGSEFKVQGRNHALQTIMGLIIDDGVPDRGHRKNIFSTDFKYVGISSRVQGDKFVIVFDFHSTNVPTKNGSKNSNNAGMNVAYESKGKQELFYNHEDKKDNWNYGLGQMGAKPGFSAGGFGGHGGQGNFGGNFAGEIAKGHSSGSGSGERHVVSKSTSTKTSTSNGVKKTLKIVKIKYSDGTEEQEEEETITQ